MKSQVGSNEVLRFTRILARRMSAGTSLVGCLRAMSEHEPGQELGHLQDEFAKAIEQGSLFSEALERHPESFDAFYVAMVKAGELYGTLQVNLEELVSVLRNQRHTRRKLLQVAAYPTAAFSICALVVAMLLTKAWMIVPGMPLTLVALVVLVATGGAACCLAGTMFARSPARSNTFDALLLCLPALGRVTRKLLVAHCLRTVGILLNHGVPILQALRVAEMTVGNARASKAMAACRESVTEGESLTLLLEALGFESLPAYGKLERPHDPDSLPNHLVRFSRELEADAHEAMDDLLAFALPLLVTVATALNALLLLAFLRLDT